MHMKIEYFEHKSEILGQTILQYNIYTEIPF